MLTKYYKVDDKLFRAPIADVKETTGFFGYGKYNIMVTFTIKHYAIVADTELNSIYIEAFKDAYIDIGKLIQRADKAIYKNVKFVGYKLKANRWLADKRGMIINPLHILPVEDNVKSDPNRYLQSDCIFDQNIKGEYVSKVVGLFAEVNDELYIARYNAEKVVWWQRLQSIHTGSIWLFEHLGLSVALLFKEDYWRLIKDRLAERGLLEFEFNNSKFVASSYYNEPAALILKPTNQEPTTEELKELFIKQASIGSVALLKKNTSPWED